MFYNGSNYECHFIIKELQPWKNIVDKSTKLCNIGFSMKYFTDIFQEFQGFPPFGDNNLVPFHLW